MASIAPHRVSTPGLMGSPMFNPALAGFAAAALGFAVFAMPAVLFESLVGATGLGGFVESAQPPLGETARLAAVGGAFLFTFALLYFVLKALDRGAPASERPALAAEPGAPRVRRADAHPDAPTRRPLFAGREIGEFVERPPFELSEFAPQADDVPALPEAEPEAPPLDLTDPVSEPAEAEFSFGSRPTLSDPDPTEAVSAEEAPRAVPDFLVPEAEIPDAPIEALVAGLPEGEPLSHSSIDELMGRLEAGIESSPVEAGPPDADPVAEPAEKPADIPPARHRLRGALDDMQRMANRG